MVALHNQSHDSISELARTPSTGANEHVIKPRMAGMAANDATRTLGRTRTSRDVSAWIHTGVAVLVMPINLTAISTGFWKRRMGRRGQGRSEGKKTGLVECLKTEMGHEDVGHFP